MKFSDISAGISINLIIFHNKIGKPLAVTGSENSIQRAAVGDTSLNCLNLLLMTVYSEIILIHAKPSNISLQLQARKQKHSSRE